MGVLSANVIQKNNVFFVSSSSILDPIITRDAITRNDFIGFYEDYLVSHSAQYHKMCQIRFENTRKMQVIHGDCPVKLQDTLERSFLGFITLQELKKTLKQTKTMNYLMKMVIYKMIYWSRKAHILLVKRRLYA